MRPLIVLLLILNLGVALWWATRDDPAPAPAAPLPAGAEPLRLLGEPAPTPAVPDPHDAAVAPAASDPAPDTLPPAAPVPGAAGEAPVAEAPAADAAGTALVCRGFGPFADADAVAEARARLVPLARALSIRQVQPGARGWQVLLRALPDRDAASATLARLVEAGFRDHYLMPAADDGRVDIALGRFGSEAAARRHRQTLADAGFPAVAEPLGDPGASRYWVDAALPAGADIAEARRASGAARSETVECAGLGAG